MKEITIWYALPNTHVYQIIKHIPLPCSNEMLILETFLDSDMKNFSEEIKSIKEDLEKEGSICFNLTCIELLPSGELALSLPIFEDLKDLVISYESLIAIIQQWDAVYKQHPPYIILERNDDIYSVRGTESIENIE